MRIITWNVNGLRATLRAGALAPVAELEPDVLCLQETRTNEQPVLIGGYEHFYNPARREGYAGTALASRVPVLDVAFGVGVPALDGEGRCITADVGGLYVVNVYAPRSDERGLRRQAFRVEWADALLDHLRALGQEKPVVVCGDMNAVLDDIDVYEENPHHGEAGVGWASDERDLLLSLLEEGYADAFRLLHPGERGAFTWWSQRRARRAVNRGWRLDYFFASADAAGAVRRCDILAEVAGSDHCPVLLDVAL